MTDKWPLLGWHVTRYIEGGMSWLLPTTALELGASELVCRAPGMVELPSNRFDGRCTTLAYCWSEVLG